MQCHHDGQRAHRAKFWGKNFFDTAEQGVIERQGRQLRARPLYGAARRAGALDKLAGEPIWNEVKKMEGKGHANAREILNTAIDLLKN